MMLQNAWGIWLSAVIVDVPLTSKACPRPNEGIVIHIEVYVSLARHPELSVIPFGIGQDLHVSVPICRAQG